ncbi:zinc finger CCCH domain-containing protein 7B-like [Aplochiton taeniatus]
MDPARQKRQDDIEKALGFIQSSLPYPDPQGYEEFVTQLVYNLLEEGNASFKDGNCDQAIKDYTEGVNVVHYAQTEELKVPKSLIENLFVNRATVYHSMAEYEFGVKDCDSALAVCEGSHKAFYSKALCLKGLGLHREAYNCITEAPLDQQMNDLAKELAGLLGMKNRKAYTGSKSKTHVQSAFSIKPSTFKPIHRQFPTALPAPSPQLPPAFFIPAVNLVDSPNTFRGLGGGDAAASSRRPTATPLDALDPLGSLDSLDALDPLGSLDSLDDLDLFPAGGESTDASDVTLDKELDSLAPFEYLHVTDTTDPRAGAAGGGKAARAAFAAAKRSDALADPRHFLNSIGLLPGPAVGEAAATFSAAGSDDLDTLDSLDDLGTLPLLKGATAAVPMVKVGGEGLDTLSDFTPPGQKSITIAPPAGRVVKPSSQMDKNGALPGPVPSKLYEHPLVLTHEFRQACSTCYYRESAGIYSYVHIPDLLHSCQRDILLCRKKAGLSSRWTRVRRRPTWLAFTGAYVLCQELLKSGDLGLCKYGEDCTFAFNQYEVDVWTHERNGTLDRDLLFETPDSRDHPVVTVQKLLQQFNGMFIFLCQLCYDSKPRIISKRSTENKTICSKPAACHPFDANKCLVHAVRTNSVNYRKIRPMNYGCQFDVCRHAVRYGCERGHFCHFAHSLIELKTWLLQKNTGIQPDTIVKESAKYLQKQEQHNSKQKITKVRGGIAKSKGGAMGEGAKSLNMKMKFVCAQCWKDGLMSEPDKALKYCSAKARHSWTKERRVLLVRSMQKPVERNKWVQVRPLPSAKTYPIQYEICGHILKQRKCTYIGNCSFAHSEEERGLWTYMKNNCLLDMQQIYEMWLSLTNHNHQEGTLLTQPVQPADEKYIVMPTDYAEPMNGYHCRLCGRHSNSERQWQQHISSEKHKDRVFGCEGEEESLTWTYRFPGQEFHLCPRLVSECPEGASCDYAHSPEELVEWKERRDFLRRKLAKAREDMLIMPGESDFGKYNFLLQD